MNVVFVVIEQVLATPPTVQDVAVLKDIEATKSLEVMIFRDEPSLVLKLGVTVKEMELSPVCMAVNLLGSDSDPVKAEI